MKENIEMDRFVTRLKRKIDENVSGAERSSASSEGIPVLEDSQHQENREYTIKYLLFSFFYVFFLSIKVSVKSKYQV